jgi:predicted negative regulator of RcsB-dependent stress response
MSIYMTEDEQIEAIKTWWKRYNGIFIVSISVVMLAFSAMKYWNWHQEKITQQASNTYEHLMIAVSNHDNKDVRAYAHQLLTEYGKTVYADAARLTLARLYVNRSDYIKAREELAYVAKHSKMLALQQVAKIRLARLLAAEHSFDGALEQLAQVDDSTYMPVVNELKGDIYTALGRYQEAVSFYREALADVQTKGMGNLFLEMKTNELAARTQSLKTEV